MWNRAGPTGVRRVWNRAGPGCVCREQRGSGEPRSSCVGRERRAWPIVHRLSGAGVARRAHLRPGRHLLRSLGSRSGTGRVSGCTRTLTASGDFLVQDLTILIHVLSPDRELRRSIRSVPVASTSPVVLSDTVLAVPRRVEAGERPVQRYDLRSAAGPGPETGSCPCGILARGWARGRHSARPFRALDARPR